jgi:peptidoglycan/LPS O-acetylase OafA/YrhL
VLRDQKIYPLTTVRFFAAFSVVLNHTLWIFLPWLPGMIHSRAGREYFKNLVSSFSFSVSFFFLLSGYVLAHVYLRDGRGVDRRRFFAARFARIYPLYLATLLLDTPRALMERVQRLGLWAGVMKTSGVFVAYLMLLQAWDARRLRGIDDPNGSISVEVFFYLCFPVIGMWLWKLRGMWLWCVALGLYVGGLLLVLEVRRYPSILVVLPPLHLSTFALGIVLARWQTLRQSDEGARPVSDWKIYGVLVLAAVASLLSAALFARFSMVDLFYCGMLAPAFLGTIWALSSKSTWVSRVLSARWLVVLGDASFAVYLIHDPMLHLFQHFHLEKRPMLYPVYLALCIGLSVMSFFYFETPSRAWLLKRLQTRSLEGVEAASAAQ